jgi:hypothetical protein
MSGSLRLTGQTGVALSGGGLRYPGVYAALDLAGNHYELASRVYGNIANVPGFTSTRASTAWGFGSDGLLQSFASNVARLVYDPVTLASLGILAEEARTNVALWNRDLTNAAWVKAGVTAAKDQTGIDGVANSASSLTATGPAATILQTIVLASSTRQQSAWVKRITGTGVVNMTTDGATWTAVTVTAGWTRVTIPAQDTVVNPVLGFQIITSGDAIAVDFVQNERGTGASSEIATTTTEVTRASDAPRLTQNFSAPLSVITEFRQNWIGPDQRAVSISDGSTNNRVLISLSNGVPAFQTRSGAVQQANITLGSAASVGEILKIAARVSTNDVQAARGGTLGAADVSATNPTGLTRVDFGPTDLTQINGTISRIRIYNRALSDAEMQSLTL